MDEEEAGKHEKLMEMVEVYTLKSTRNVLVFALN